MALRIIDALVRPGDWCVDVGAHEGVIAAALQQRSGPRGRVLAVEPLPAHHPRLRRLARRRRGMSLLAAALSDAAGVAELQVPVVGGRSYLGMGSLEDVRARHSAQVTTHRVRTVRMDDVLRGAPRLDFLKIDVEGHEDRVLAGAAQVLRRHRPTVLIELELRHRGRGFSDTVARLEALGLTGWMLDRDRLRPIAELDLERHQLRYVTRGLDREVMPEGYVHDFLFTRRDPGPLR